MSTELDVRTLHMTLCLDDGQEFRWHGGEYIEIGYTQAQGEPGIDGDNFHAIDVINVWNYELGAPYIARTLDGMKTAVEEWLFAQREEQTTCAMCGDEIGPSDETGGLCASCNADES